LSGTPPHLIALIQVCTGVLLLAPWANLGAPPQQASAWASLLTLGDRAARWGSAPPSTAHDELIAQAARDSGVDRALLTA
ncbi:hypothetical protein SB783_48570, partial [Paraburkholderia sp. SIMBA_009]